MFDSQKDKKWHLLNRLQQKSPTVYFFVDLILNILIIVVLVYGVRTYLISPFQVFGPSMCDTLNLINEQCQEGFGEYLIVNKAKRFSPPQRGDIVVFRPPHNPNDFYIKRVIGLPGEKVKIQNGKVFINGQALQEDYLNNENKNRTSPLSSPFTSSYEVPGNRYFVLGDNRRKSTDSRTCFRGPADRSCDKNDYFLSIEAIEGKAWIVLWPFNKMRLLHNPDYALVK